MAEIHVDADPFAPEDVQDAYRPRPRSLALAASPKPVAALVARKARWQSKTGCSALIEMICESIRANKAEGSKFEMACRVSGFTTEQLWAIYDDWCTGKLHPLLIKEPTVTIKK